MLDSTEKEYFDEYDNASLNYAWWSIPSFVKWLKNSREENRIESYPINLTIILHTTTLIEGFINQLLVEECGSPIYNHSTEDRLLIELNKRLESASWGNYQELFVLIIGKRISEFTTHKNWKSISILFQLRNMLTHGKSVELKFYEKNQKEPVVSGKFKNVYEYFKEVKLINVDSKDFLPVAVRLVTSESSDYFYQECIFLIDSLYKQIGKSDKYNNQIAEAYEMVFEE